MEHIIWQCPRHHRTRQKYKALLEDYLEKMKRRTPARARELEEVMQKPCFKNCGICVSKEEEKACTRDLQQTDPMLYNVTSEQLNWAEGLEVNEEGYIMAYPDGSAIDTQSRATARAGWAVYYKGNPKYHASDALRGPIKNSYRAEVRAIAHIVSTATHPTHIRSDCKSAVTLFNKLQRTEMEDISEWPESDLWEVIKDKIPENMDAFFKCTWIPSHLGETGKQLQLQKAILAGLITQEDVSGNDKADSMAKETLKLEEIPPRILQRRRDRQTVTAVTQYMMVKIWDEHLQYTFEKKEPGNEFEKEEQHEADATKKKYEQEYGVEEQDLRELEFLDEFYSNASEGHGHAEDAEDYHPFGIYDWIGDDVEQPDNRKRKHSNNENSNCKARAVDISSGDGEQHTLGGVSVTKGTLGKPPTLTSQTGKYTLGGTSMTKGVAGGMELPPDEVPTETPFGGTNTTTTTNTTTSDAAPANEQVQPRGRGQKVEDCIGSAKIITTPTTTTTTIAGNGGIAESQDTNNHTTNNSAIRQLERSLEDDDNVFGDFDSEQEQEEQGEPGTERSIGNPPVPLVPSATQTPARCEDGTASAKQINDAGAVQGKREVNGPEDMDIYRLPVSDNGVVIASPQRATQIGVIKVAIKADQTDGSANNKTKQVIVPLMVYEAMRRWLTNMRWSCHFLKSSHRPADHEIGHYTVTWMELITDFAAFACANTQLPGEDIEDQVSVGRAIFRKICRTGDILDGEGNRFSYKEFFDPSSSVTSLKWVTGLRLPGLMRRPIWSEQQTRKIFKALIKVKTLTPNAAGFGRGYTFGKDYLQLQTKRLDLSRSTQARLQPILGPCVYGHSTTGATDNGRARWYHFPEYEYHSLPTALANGKTGDTVCSKCYSRLIRIKSKQERRVGLQQNQDAENANKRRRTGIPEAGENVMESQGIVSQRPVTETPSADTASTAKAPPSNTRFEGGTVGGTAPADCKSGAPELICDGGNAQSPRAVLLPHRNNPEISYSPGVARPANANWYDSDDDLWDSANFTAEVRQSDMMNQPPRSLASVTPGNHEDPNAQSPRDNARHQSSQRSDEVPADGEAHHAHGHRDVPRLARSDEEAPRVASSPDGDKADPGEALRADLEDASGYQDRADAHEPLGDQDHDHPSAEEGPVNGATGRAPGTLERQGPQPICNRQGCLAPASKMLTPILKLNKKKKSRLAGALGAKAAEPCRMRSRSLADRSAGYDGCQGIRDAQNSNPHDFLTEAEGALIPEKYFIELIRGADWDGPLELTRDFMRLLSGSQTPQISRGSESPHCESSHGAPEHVQVAHARQECTDSRECTGAGNPASRTCRSSESQQERDYIAQADENSLQSERMENWWQSLLDIPTQHSIEQADHESLEEGRLDSWWQNLLTHDHSRDSAVSEVPRRNISKGVKRRRHAYESGLPHDEWPGDTPNHKVALTQVAHDHHKVVQHAESSATARPPGCAPAE